VTWDEALDHIAASFAAGYETGYTHRRDDRLKDEHQAAVHEYACRVIGLRPDDVDAPRWAVAS
jgi:hypothetical protein